MAACTQRSTKRRSTRGRRRSEGRLLIYVVARPSRRLSRHSTAQPLHWYDTFGSCADKAANHDKPVVAVLVGLLDMLAHNLPEIGNCGTRRERVELCLFRAVDKVPIPVFGLKNRVPSSTEA